MRERGMIRLICLPPLHRHGHIFEGYISQMSWGTENGGWGET